MCVCITIYIYIISLCVHVCVSTCVRAIRPDPFTDPNTTQYPPPKTTRSLARRPGQQAAQPPPGPAILLPGHGGRGAAADVRATPVYMNIYIDEYMFLAPNTSGRWWRLISARRPLSQIHMTKHKQLPFQLAALLLQLLPPGPSFFVHTYSIHIHQMYEITYKNSPPIHTYMHTSIYITKNKTGGGPHHPAPVLYRHEAQAPLRLRSRGARSIY